MMLVMIISNMTFLQPLMSFAETKSPAQLLKQWQLIEGNPDGSFNEKGQLTRAEMMVILSKLNGEQEQAKYYTGVTSFKDVPENSWYYPYVAYAELKKWTSGSGKNQFKPQSSLSYNEGLVFMLKTLDYPVTDFKNVKAQASSLGLDVSSVIGNDRPLIREELFSLMLSALKIKKKGSYQSLAGSLNIAYEESTVNNPYEVQIVSAKAENQRTVTLSTTEPINEKQLSTLVIKDASDLPVAITSKMITGAKEVVLTTQTLATNTVYSAVSKNKINFSLTQTDNKEPEVIRVRAASTTHFFIDYSKDMDPKTTLDPSSYMLSNGLLVKSVEFDQEKSGKLKRFSIRVNTSKQVVGTNYTIQYNKVIADSAGNRLVQTNEKRLVSFIAPSLDTNSPKLISAEIKDLNTILLTFEDESNLDAMSAESIITYSLTNKSNAVMTASVVSAKLLENTEGKYLLVELKTTELTTMHQYEIKANALFDEFSNQISLNLKNSALAIAPGTMGDLRITSVNSINVEKLRVVFNKPVSKVSDLSLQFALRGAIELKSIEFDANSNNVVYLNTGVQVPGVNYSVNVAVNQFKEGKYNKIKDLTFDFSGAVTDQTKPKIKLIEVVNVNNEAVVSITYTEAVDMQTALNVNAYTINNGVGTPLTVTYKADNQVYLKTKPVKDNLLYVVSISGVKDLAGNAFENNALYQSFVGKTDYTTSVPKVVQVVANDMRSVTVVFNKPMKLINNTKPFLSDALVSTAASDPDNYKVNNKTSGVAYSPSHVAVNKDATEISLRFAEDILKADVSFELTINSNGDDGFDGIVTAISDVSGEKLLPEYGKFTFNGSSLAAPRPYLVNIQAMNNTEIQLVFSEPVTLTGKLSYGDVSVTTQNGGVIYINALDNGVVPDKPHIITCRVDSKLPIATTPRVTVNDFSKIRDKFYNFTPDVVSGVNNVLVSVPNVDNVGPVAISVESFLGHLVVTFDRIIDEADRYDYRVVTNHGQELPSMVEFDNMEKSKIHLYYDYEHITDKQLYSVMIRANAVRDASGSYNLIPVELPYVAVGGTLEAPILAMVRATGQDTLDVGFSQPVTNQLGTTGGNAFVISTLDNTQSITIKKAFNGTEEIELVNGKIPAGKPFSMLQIKVNKLLYSGVEHYFFLDRNTAAFQNLYGKVVFQSSMQPFVGVYDLSKQLQLTGVTVATPGTGLISVKDDPSNPALATTGYTKYLVFKQETALSKYDAVQDIVKTINMADFSLATAKGTSIEMGVVPNKNYDVLVVFLDDNNTVVGYHLKKSLAVK